MRTAPPLRRLLPLCPLSALMGAAAPVPVVALVGTENGFVAYACPIEGQKGAMVLGHDGDFQAACLSLSRPGPGPSPMSGG